MIANPKPMNIEPNNSSKIIAIGTLAKFSVYRAPIKNTIPEREMTLIELYKLIKSDRYQKQTEALRAITDQAQARAFKASQLNYVTLSGVFSKRSDSALLHHSGLLTLDIDHVSNLPMVKATLLADSFLDIKLMFKSPTGYGLKAAVNIDLEKGSHLQWFNAISNYIRETYQIKLDASGKDPSRAAFLCYDPEIYIHPDLFTQFSNPLHSNNHESN